jgi:GMP synthase-like glutamine amidotransferase
MTIAVPALPIAARSGESGGRRYARRVSQSDRPGLILQHGELGPPGILAEWLDEREIAYAVHPVWRKPLPADPAGYAWIATLGSEHTPGVDGAPEWIDAEIEFLRGALAAEVPVLGLCFGGQALAVAAGGAVHRADPAEIGWLEVETEAAELIPPGPWLHYHYDQLVPPPEATAIARTASGSAAFVLGRSVGLQFHPEATPETVAKWTAEDPKLPATEAERVALEGVEAAPRAERSARRLFDAWWARLWASG